LANVPTMRSGPVCDMDGCEEKATFFLSVNNYAGGYMAKNSQRCKAHDNLPRLLKP
jgi:hypothetical protein